MRKYSGSIGERFEMASQLKRHLVNRVSSISEVEVNSPEDGSPYIINISVVGRRSEIMLHYLESRDIYVSSGSACSKGQQSGVLEEFGIRDKRADGALRISITAETTEDELDIFASALHEGIVKVRS